MTLPAHLTEQDELAIVAAYPKRGVKVLAQDYHVAKHRITSILDAHGVARAKAGATASALHAARNAQVLALWDAGTPVLDIAVRVGVSREWVQVLLREAGRVVARKRVYKPRCRCCGILLSECGDARHEAWSHNGVCLDCHDRYIEKEGQWRRRPTYVLELEPLQMAGGCAGEYAHVGDDRGGIAQT